MHVKVRAAEVPSRENRRWSKLNELEVGQRRLSLLISVHNQGRLVYFEWGDCDRQAAVAID